MKTVISLVSTKSLEPKCLSKWSKRTPQRRRMFYFSLVLKIKSKVMSWWQKRTRLRSMRLRLQRRLLRRMWVPLVNVWMSSGLKMRKDSNRLSLAKWLSLKAHPWTIDLGTKLEIIILLRRLEIWLSSLLRFLRTWTAPSSLKPKVSTSSQSTLIKLTYIGFLEIIVSLLN